MVSVQRKFTNFGFILSDSEYYYFSYNSLSVFPFLRLLYYLSFCLAAPPEKPPRLTAQVIISIEKTFTFSLDLSFR